LLVSIAIIGVVAGAMTASAATLRLRSFALSAASAPVVACDQDGIDVRYGLGWRGQITIEHLTVNGIDDACVGLSITVVMSVAGDPVELGPARISRDDRHRVVVRLDVPGVVPALDLERVDVAIA
jgi:hypothetical protein